MKAALLEKSKHPFQAIPFDQIASEDFVPAIDDALAEARKQLAAIREECGPATFANTIEALESSGEKLDLVSGVFSNLLHAHTNEQLQKDAQTILPKLAEFSNDLYLDEKLFARVKQVQESSEAKALSPEKKRLLEKTYLAFTRNGALLDEKGKAKIREIDRKLSEMTQTFSENVLKGTNAFTLHLTSEAELAGLPPTAIDGARQAAEERKLPGWVITLQYPSMGPFLTYSERRELREKLWRAAQTRATAGEIDNRGLAIEIARLRHERAKLLGYGSHAEFVLKERMASTPEQVKSFLERLRGVYRKAAERDLEELRAFSGLGKDLKPWDVSFWSEKLKKKKFDLDDEVTRPYFALDRVIEGVFEHARRLYGLTFKVRKDLPVYHPDVQVYEVNEEGSGRYIGLFYADFFPRASKQGGAWMTLFKDQGLREGAVERPHASIVCNLTRPTTTRPSLLTLNEVRTIFHEFGHALHGLLSDTTYRSLAGPHVYWDFVELPSQIMENWVRNRESLDLFARHHETGEKIPDELVKKIRESARFQAGWMGLRQLSFALLDMAWHSKALPVDLIPEAVENFERGALVETALFEPVPGSITSTSFTHIFSGGYAAGYYSYKWAEVLDADAFELFEEKGIFNREVAMRFRNEVLARGDTAHPMELYRKFRGREPDPNALFRRDGLI